MSSNAHLSFNVAKATPTISTTSASTMSSPPKSNTKSKTNETSSIQNSSERYEQGSYSSLKSVSQTECGITRAKGGEKTSENLDNLETMGEKDPKWSDSKGVVRSELMDIFDKYDLHHGSSTEAIDNSDREKENLVKNNNEINERIKERTICNQNNELFHSEPSQTSSQIVSNAEEDVKESPKKRQEVRGMAAKKEEHRHVSVDSPKESNNITAILDSVTEGLASRREGYKQSTQSENRVQDSAATSKGQDANVEKVNNRDEQIRKATCGEEQPLVSIESPKENPDKDEYKKQNIDQRFDIWNKSADEDAKERGRWDHSQWESEEKENKDVQERINEPETDQNKAANADDECNKSFNSVQTPSIDTKEKKYSEQGHKPFDFQAFLNNLKRKSADPLVRYIRSFLMSFSKQGYTFSVEQKINILRDFKEFMDNKFLSYEPFASMEDSDFENSQEGLEKLLMNRLYSFCFSPEIAQHSEAGYIQELVKNDVLEDESFSKQIEKFNWVNGVHLDIDLEKLSGEQANSEKNRFFFDLAVGELSKINNYRAPRDKTVCILNFSKVILGFLRVNQQETNADSFVPLLILIIIKAKVKNLISNIRYIQRYRREGWIGHGETSYYLSSLEAAIDFIKKLNKSNLTVDEREYQAHMEAWDAQVTLEEMQLKTSESSHNDFSNASPERRKEGSSNIEESSSSRNLLSNAGMLTRSISKLLSPSPTEEGLLNKRKESQNLSEREARGSRALSLPSGGESQAESRVKETYKALRELFPNLDKPVLKDVIRMHKGDMEDSLETCLSLVNEV